MLEASLSKTLLSFRLHKSRGKTSSRNPFVGKEQNQSWKTLSYVWNEEQTDAFLNIIGGETRTTGSIIREKSKTKLCDSQSNPVQKLPYVG